MRCSWNRCRRSNQKIKRIKLIKNQYICQKKLKNEKIFKKIKKILINVLTFKKKYSNINKRSEIVLETW